MEYIYYSTNTKYDIEEIIKNKILKSTTIYDRSSRKKYLRIESGFDTETSKIKISGNSLLEYTAYCYHWQFGFGDIAIMGRHIEEFNSVLSTVVDYINEFKPKCRLMVLDANLGYEWQFCKKYWAELNITKVFAKEPRNPLMIELCSAIEFREILGLFGKSLEQVAKNYCEIKKLVGDLDYSKVRLSDTPMTEKEIKYCVRDVEILCKLSKYIFEHFFNDNPRLPYTSTGLIRDEIKRQYGKSLKRQKEMISSWMPDEITYELFRRYLFKGGICGSNIKLMNKKLIKVRGADITSDYPFHMLTKLFPWGKAVVTSNSEFCKKRIPYIAVVKFRNFRSKTQHAIMSAHKVLNKEEMKINKNTILDNNRIQYGENVKLVINDIEYYSLKKAYKWDDAIVLKCWEFPEGYRLLPVEIRKVCIKQYLIKESLKAEHSDTQEYRDAKAFVNGIFGMMCTALYFDDLVFIEEECSIDNPRDEEGMPVRKPYDECIKNLFLSPYWGFWITSYAREMLIDVITKYPNVIVQYDTDSVYFVDDSEESEHLKNYLVNKNNIYLKHNKARFKNDHMNKLGTWDFTAEFKTFKALGAKRYMYEKQNGKIEVTIAGCRKKRIKNTDKYISTLLVQNNFNNIVNYTNTDPFDFFTNNMVIDSEHSQKKASTYIDSEISLLATDYLGNSEYITSRSAIVLTEIPFTMTMGKDHAELLIAVERYMRNSKDGAKVYDIWRKLKRLKRNT